MGWVNIIMVSKVIDYKEKSWGESSKSREHPLTMKIDDQKMQSQHQKNPLGQQVDQPRLHPLLKQATIVMQQTTVEQLYHHSYEPMGLWVSGFCDIF